MGTRNLTMVISNGETKIAQYGQWDGYPDGQGATILDFLSKSDLNVFREKLFLCRFIDNKFIEEEYRKVGHKGGEWVDTNIAAAFNRIHPQLSRGVAGDILEFVYKSDTEVLLKNEENFAADSLFCEWAYVVDLDKNTFEVYEGFNMEPLAPEDRFFYLESKRSGKYYPVKMIGSYSLNELPTEKQFLADLIPKEEEEEEEENN